MHQNEKRTCSACETIAFSLEICRLVAFSFSSSLRKVPNKIFKGVQTFVAR